MEFSTVAKADIFFVLAGLGVMLVTAFVLVAVGYAIGILRDVKRTTGAVRRQIEHVSDDLDFVHEKMKEGAQAVGNRVQEEIRSVAIQKVIYVIVGVLIGILKLKIKKDNSERTDKKRTSK